jgi:hypothetical protein
MMKRCILLFVLLTAIRHVVLAQGVNQVDEAPQWFLHPPEDSYVGVSLPLENTLLAVQQAVQVALLSYMLQNDSEMSFTQHSNAQKGEFKEWRKLAMVLPNAYEIKEMTQNKYGEVFVALQNVSFADSTGAKLFFESHTDRINEAYNDSAEELSLTSNAFKLHVKVLYRGEETTVSGMVQSSTGKEYLPDTSYRYAPTATEWIFDTHISRASLYSITHSLGITYAMLLLNAFFKTGKFTIKQILSDEESTTTSTVDVSERKGTPIKGISIYENILFVSVYNSKMYTGK